MTFFYLALECGACDNEFLQLMVTAREHLDLPVIPATVAERSRFVCTYCGAMHHTGVINLHVEHPPLAVDEDEVERD